MLEYTVDSITSSLLERARQRDETAWSRLVHLYGPLVYKWCRSFGLTAEEARDVGQEVFKQVAMHIRRFERKKDSGSFQAWLRIITKNKMRDNWRKKAKFVPAEVGPIAYEVLKEVPFEEDHAVADSHRDDVRDVFKRILSWGQATIKPVHWDIFCRVVIDERLPNDVAKEYGTSRSNVDKIKSRVLSKLRDEFGGHMDHGPESRI